MSKKEKALKALEICIVKRDAHDCITACPYSDVYRSCINELLYDCWEALKQKEPRVMTLDEVIAHYSLPPVFVDDLGAQEDYYEDIQPLYFEFPHDSEDPWIVHWRGHAQVARYLDEWRHSYNKEWRCWTSRPTDAQREAEAWPERG